MSETTSAKHKTTNPWLNQLTELSDDFYDLLVANADLYDLVEEAFYQQSRDDSAKNQMYQDAVLMTQRLRTQSAHIERMIEGLHLQYKTKN